MEGRPLSNICLVFTLTAHARCACRYGELLHAMYDELRGDRRFSDQEPTLSASSTFDPLCRSTTVRI